MQNTRMAHLDVEMDWASMGWDLRRSGEVSACVYDAGDYNDNDCSVFVAFISSSDDDAGGVSDGGVEGEQ